MISKTIKHLVCKLNRTFLFKSLKTIFVLFSAESHVFSLIIVKSWKLHTRYYKIVIFKLTTFISTQIVQQIFILLNELMIITWYLSHYVFYFWVRLLILIVRELVFIFCFQIRYLKRSKGCSAFSTHFIVIYKF